MATFSHISLSETVTELPLALCRRAFDTMFVSTSRIRTGSTSSTNVATEGLAESTTDFLSASGVILRTTSPQEFTKFLENEVTRWAKVVKDNNIVVKN